MKRGLGLVWYSDHMAEMTFKSPGIYDAMFPCNRCETTHYTQTVCKGWTKHHVKTDLLPDFLERHLDRTPSQTFNLVEASRMKQRHRFAEAGGHPKHQTPCGDPLQFWEDSPKWDISESGIDSWTVYIEDHPK